MLSFHVKFVQTDGQTDGQRYNNMPLIFQYEGIKMMGCERGMNLSWWHSSVFKKKLAKLGVFFEWTY